MVIKWTAIIPESRNTSTMSERTPSLEEQLPLEPGDSGPNSYPSSALSTASARESIYNYETEYGRTYHAFRRGKYCFPNDEGELDRMDIHYHCMRLIMKGRHWLAPIQSPRMILDVGAGTGIWGIDVADDHEKAHVIGIDLSPNQPTSVRNSQRELLLFFSLLNWHWTNPESYDATYLLLLKEMRQIFRLKSDFEDLIHRVS